MFEKLFGRKKEKPTDSVEEMEEVAPVEESPAEPEKPLSLLERFRLGLGKTRDNISKQINAVVANYRKVDEDLFEDLEDILIGADIGVASTMEIMDELRDKVKMDDIQDPLRIKDELKAIMKSKLITLEAEEKEDLTDPQVILVIGVNGVGKTTTIGKLAHRYKQAGKKVVLAAADTFRAAAIEQLTEWSRRAGVDIVAHQEGADPASVIFDAIASSKSKGADVLICDTAGRLHNKKNLMNELEKINRITAREFPEAIKEVYLVLDATTGQNAVSQAKEFMKVCDITGIVLTKLDGTAKGGVVFPLQLELQVPVTYVGIGEGIDNLELFHGEDFVDAIFE